MRETFLEQYLVANLGCCDGTVFFFCHRDDDARRAMLVRAAQAAGRRIADVLDMDAQSAESAVCCGRFAFFVSFSMRDALDRYLDACPQGVRHLLVCSRHGGKRSIPIPFWDFFEERGAEVWDIDAPEFFRDRSWWLMRILVHPDHGRLDEMDPKHEQYPSHRMKSGDIGCVRLTRVKGLQTVEERQLCPNLYDLSVEELLEQLERLRETGCFLLNSRDFTLSVLKTAYRRCGKKQFPPFYLTLDDMMESQGLPAPNSLEQLMETLPLPPASWPDDPPQMRGMQGFYQLTRTLLCQLEAAEDGRREAREQN